VRFSGAEGAELNAETGGFCPAHDGRQPQVRFRTGETAHDGNLGAKGKDLGRLDEHAANADVFGHPPKGRAAAHFARHWGVDRHSGVCSLVLHDWLRGREAFARSTPLRRDPDVVKTPPEAAEGRPRAGSFRRHLRGYELGLVTLAMVLTCALLALPRASVPDTLPLPKVDREEAQRSAERERELSALAEAQGLPFEARALGESIRHFGQSVNEGLDTTHDREDIRQRFKLAIAKGQAPLLLRLRAVQTKFFLAAVADLERNGKPSTDLRELGADFLPHAQHNGWFAPNWRCLADEATLRVLFYLHWADLIDRRGTFPYAPSLNDWRIYYRFLLLHPATSSEPASPSPDAERLRVVNALAHKDPDYPRFFASGYLYYRLDDREAAATAFRSHLAQHESGPYALLARNYLIHLLQGVSSE
jgi:hypothetical protein